MLKRIRGLCAEAILVFVFMFGLILCMCETSNIEKQVYVTLAGTVLMITTVLYSLLKEWRKPWQMN